MRAIEGNEPVGSDHTLQSHLSETLAPASFIPIFKFRPLADQ